MTPVAMGSPAARYRGAAGHAGRHVAGLPFQDPEQPLLDPDLTGWIVLGMRAERRLPQVLAHVDEVEDDREVQAPSGREQVQGLRLFCVAVDEGHPLLPVIEVAALGLSEGHWQVQLGVEGMEAVHAVRSVSQTLHVHAPEHGAQLPLMDARPIPFHAVRALHRSGRFARPTAVDVRL